MPNVTREEYQRDQLTIHQKLDTVSADVSYIRGKLDARKEQKKDASTILGILVAIGIGILNWFK